jgi:DNA-binding GntR family transcriptional regulator
MVEESDPALIILRRYRGEDGVIFLVTYSVHPENRFSLNIEFEKRDPL